MSTPASWIRNFVDAVTQQITPVRTAAPINCHYVQVSGTWEITIFMEPIEVVGGPEDGSVKQVPFGVRIGAILDLFQTVTDCGWQTVKAGSDDDLGAHLSVEGLYKGRQVWLRILAEVPQKLNFRQVVPAPQVTQEDLW